MASAGTKWPRYSASFWKNEHFSALRNRPNIQGIIYKGEVVVQALHHLVHEARVVGATRSRCFGVGTELFFGSGSYEGSLNAFMRDDPAER